MAAFSRVFYSPSGTDYAIPFAYQAGTEITVFVGGVVSLQPDWAFLNASTIRFASIPATTVAIVRATQKANAKVVFSDGTVDYASDHNIADTQNLYGVQEAFDLADAALGLDLADGVNFNARAKRITNLSGPVGDNDAPTVGWSKIHTVSFTEAGKFTAHDGQINDLADPVLGTDATNVNWVRDNTVSLVDGKLSAQSKQIINLAAPLLSTDATNKGYVDFEILQAMEGHGPITNDFGTLNVTPQDGDTGNFPKGFNVTQSATGLRDDGTAQIFNYVKVVSDDVELSGAPINFQGPFHNAVAIEHHFGGANMTGGVNSLNVDSAFYNGATSPTNGNRNYAAIAGHTWVASGDGGTDTLGWPSGGKGAFFSGWFLVTALPGAENLVAAQSVEINTDAHAGSSGWLKIGLTIAGESTDVQAFTHNFGMDFSGKGGSLGYDSLISLNDYHGKEPMRSTGGVMSVDTADAVLQTCAFGIDLSKLDITGSFLKGQSFEIAGRTGVTTWVHDGTKYAGGDATRRGDLRMIGSSQATGTEDQDGGIEFKTSNSGSGYGNRIVGFDLGGGLTTLTFQRRSNSGSWVQSFNINNQGGVITFVDPTVYYPIAAPASPGAGWIVYTDTADGKLKAKDSAGTVRELAIP